MAKSMLEQLTQVGGSNIYDDTLNSQLAETCGRDVDSGTMSTVSGSTTMSGSGFSDDFEKDDVGNFIVIGSGAAAGIYEIVDVNSTVSVDVSPAAAGTDASAVATLHLYKNLEDDLNYLRRQLNVVIGENNWYDNPCSDIKSMCYLIPKRPNYIGETGQYTARPGTVSWSLSDIDQTGKVSSGNTSAYYTDNTSSVSPGYSGLRFTNDNTMVISITGGFYPADTGYLRVYKDGAIVGELNLATAWTNDGCSYETSEADVGTNPGHTASNAGTDIINLTNRRCMNDSVDNYGYFWPPYQIASASITLTLPEGYAGLIYVSHTDGGSNQNYTYSEFWVDTTSSTVSVNAPTVTQLTPVVRYLSGVPFYTNGATFTISGSNASTIADEGYPVNPARFNVGEFNMADITLTYTDFGISEPLAITQTLASGASKTITVGAGDFRDLDARATMTVWNVFASGVSTNSAAGTFRIDSYGNTGTTNTIELFNTETYRMKGTENFTDTSIDQTDSAWNVTENILTLSGTSEKGLVTYNGALAYPSINNSSGYLPSGGPNYSGASGDCVYYRVFIATGAFTNGTITFNGWTNAKTTIEGANVDVYLRMPNCTDYGNGNTSVWQDLAVDQQTYGGNGCQGSGSSGSVIGFSFGTTSSSSFGNRIIMKIVFHNSGAVALNSITFSPTL